MEEKKNDFNAGEIEGIEIPDRAFLDKHKDILPPMDSEYWLQGGLCIIPVKKLDGAVVYGTSFGTDLDTMAGIRPVIEFSDPNRFIFSHRGDILNFEGKEWMVVSRNEAVCNGFIYKGVYSRIGKTSYPESDINGYLEYWLNDLKQKEGNREEPDEEPEHEEIDR